MNQRLERNYFLLARTAVVVLAVGILAAASVSGAFRSSYQSVRYTVTNHNAVTPTRDGKNGDSQPQALPAISTAALERYRKSIHRKHVAHQAAIAKALASRQHASALDMPTSRVPKSAEHA